MPDLSYAEAPDGPATKANWTRFAFAHMAQHRDYIRVAFQMFGVELQEYILDPFDPQNLGMWPWHHQVMTDQLSLLINVSSYNFQELDFDDPDNLHSWIDQHSDWHNRASSVLGL